MNKSRQQAYTLVEVMVVVAIIGILASIGLPAYLKTMTNARRSDAEQAMQLFRQAMERHYSKTYSYRGAAQNGDIGTPKIFSDHTPVEGGSGSGFYSLAITYASPNCFELRATPVVGSSQEGELCGTLYLNHSGQRGSDINDGSCWNGTDVYTRVSEVCE